MPDADTYFLKSTEGSFRSKKKSEKIAILRLFFLKQKQGSAAKKKDLSIN